MNSVPPVSVWNARCNAPRYLRALSRNIPGFYLPPGRIQTAKLMIWCNFHSRCIKEVSPQAPSSSLTHLPLQFWLVMSFTAFSLSERGRNHLIYLEALHREYTDGFSITGLFHKSRWETRIGQEKEILNKGENSELLGQSRSGPVGEPSSFLRGVRVTGTTLDHRERQLHDEDLSGGTDPRISD